MSTYKSRFEESVTELVAQNIEDRPERIAAIDALINSYVEETGMVPESIQLNRLTNYILKEELEDRNWAKSRTSERPFHGVQAGERRQSKEYRLDKVEEIYDSNGKKVTKPIARR